MATTLTPVTPITIKGWQVTMPPAPGVLLEALATVATGGYTGHIVCTPSPVNGATWTLELLHPTLEHPLQVNVGDWIVFDGFTARVLDPTTAAALYTFA